MENIMKMEVFSVYDSKTEAYLQPFFAVNRMVAIRMFSDLANDSDHMFGKHPHDFALFKVADFDDASGRIEALEVNQNLGLAHEFKEPEIHGNEELPMEIVR